MTHAVMMMWLAVALRTQAGSVPGISIQVRIVEKVVKRTSNLFKVEHNDNPGSSLGAMHHDCGTLLPTGRGHAD